MRSKENVPGGTFQEKPEILKILYVIIGCVSVVLGIVGIFIPGLPTTPFLLLSSWLFYKSSKRLHNALNNSRWLGPYLRRFQDKKGVDRTTKLVSIICMWTMISVSSFCFFENWHIRLLLFFLGFVGMSSILFLVPTAKK